MDLGDITTTTAMVIPGEVIQIVWGATILMVTDGLSDLILIAWVGTTPTVINFTPHYF